MLPHLSVFIQKVDEHFNGLKEDIQRTEFRNLKQIHFTYKLLENICPTDDFYFRLYKMITSKDHYLAPVSGKSGQNTLSDDDFNMLPSTGTYLSDTDGDKEQPEYQSVLTIITANFDVPPTNKIVQCASFIIELGTFYPHHFQ